MWVIFHTVPEMKKMSRESGPLNLGPFECTPVKFPKKHIVPIARLEAFRPLKASKLEAFRGLKPYSQIGGF